MKRERAKRGITKLESKRRRGAKGETWDVERGGKGGKGEQEGERGEKFAEGDKKRHGATKINRRLTIGSWSHR